MKFPLTLDEPKVVIRLDLSDEQAARLRALQRVFAQACNSIAPLVASSRCWNRVGLHHLVYKDLREKFPQLGSQMACNAIYSVSKAARRVYQDPKSPWCAGRGSTAPLPVLRFLPGTPVFFDRHTLSLKAGVVSLFTLDGRLRFQINVSPQLEARFAAEKLREIALMSDQTGYVLRFMVGDADAQPDLEGPELAVVVGPAGEPGQQEAT